MWLRFARKSSLETAPLITVASGHRMNAKFFSALVFPACVMAVVVLGLVQPNLFQSYAGFDLKRLIIPLIQIIMFGMGATLSLDDFLRVGRLPKPVAIGFVAQYTIMPTLSWVIASAFHFEPEVAAGFILVGAVSGGVASNVITYLAGGNVPLSVTMTLCSTLACPFVTPPLMKLLAGRLIEFKVIDMMLSIANMILLPVAVGLFANLIFFGKAGWNRRAAPVLSLFALFTVTAALLFSVKTSSSSAAEIILGLALGASFIALMSAAKWWFNIRLQREDDWLNRILPVVSMAGICLIIGIITSRARTQLMSVGPALLVASLLLNSFGYALGYWAARAARMNETDSRTVAIEVGMQNAGMATGIAMNVLNSASAALASVVYGPLMNVTGALLAGYWKGKPISDHAPIPSPSNPVNLVNPVKK
jgi:bile acid:Na+ symporter, BASS family